MGLIRNQLELFVKRSAEDYLERERELFMAELRRNFLAIGEDMIEVFGRDVRLDFGKADLTFPGSTTSNELAIQHRLGRVPIAIFTIPTYHNTNWAVGLRVNVRSDWSTITGDQFVIRGKSDGAIGPGSIPVFWLALG